MNARVRDLGEVELAVVLRLRRLVVHPLSPFRRRTLYALLVLFVVMAVGIEGLHLIEGWSYIDSAYFMSLLATTQGPAEIPRTDAGKIFASIMAFVSVGAALSSAAFVFGPAFGILLKEGMFYIEREERRIARRVRHGHESARQTQLEDEPMDSESQT